MKKFLTLFFLVPLLHAQQAYNNLIIKSNLTVRGSATITNFHGFGSDQTFDFGYELQDTVDYSLALTPTGDTPTENLASPRPKTVATIASMISDIDPALVPAFSRITVLGYYSAGDGGGGDFRRVLASSGVTNTGTFFASTFNALYAWERVNNEQSIDVRWFGAKGDSATDDTAALDAARDYVANSARTSGVSTVLYLPRGNYLHSGSFTISDQIRLAGDGLETSGAGNGTSIVCTGDNVPAVIITGQNVQLEDIEIRYQRFQDITKTNSYGIQFNGEIYKYVIRNVAVRRGYDAIYGEREVNAYNGTIDNLFIRSFSHSALRLLCGGTVNSWNNVYIQNLADVTVSDTASITNVTLTNGTNITFSCSGSLPALLTTNRQFLVSGLDSAYNTKYFVRAISGSDIYCDASSTRSAPVDVTGTVKFFAQPATGYPIELGNGQHVFVGLDVEHIVTDADSIIYAPTYNYIHIVDVQLEALYRSSGGIYMVNSPNGDVAIGSVHMNNMGFNVGSTNYILRTGASTSALVVGNLTARDIASAGAEWYVGSAAAGAEYPLLSSRKEPRTFRANSNGTPTGDGDLRTVLGGGDTTMTIDADAGSVDVFGAANFNGSFLLTNNAPVITAFATNGISGLRINVFGGGANMVRFQTNFNTTHTFGSDGSISATSATIPTITVDTALNVGGTATFTGATIISNSTPVLTAKAGNGISGLRIDVTGADANNLVRFQTNGTTTHTFKSNGDIELTPSGSTLRNSASENALAPAYTTLTSGTTVTWTMTAGRAVQNAHLTLATNATLSVSGIANGMTGVLIVQQDGSGGRTLALPANSKVVNGGSGAITLTTTAGAFDVLSFTYNGTNYFWTYGKNFN